MFDSLDQLNRLVEAVRQAGADIAPDYTDYVRLAFAIATDCGEMGREGFLALCSLSAKFDRANADRLFSNALRTGDRRVHLGTAFHLAELAGVTLAAVEARTSPEELPAGPEEEPTGDPEPTEESDPFAPLPHFPEQSGWPSLLEQIIGFGDSPEQRDVLLLGALTALGASLSPHLRFLYGGKWFHSSLQTFVVAPPASGKGVLSWIRLLVQPIHDEIRQAVAHEMKQYRRAMASYQNLGREKSAAEEPEMPANRMFIFSGNNTGTGILQNIIDSNGVGIICETEADMVSNSILSDHGHWSEVIRTAFDHDPLSYNRRMDREYRELRQSFLSVLISGTPGQVKPLIPSSENGLFSRNLFYYMPRIRTWQNQFGSRRGDVSGVFRRLGKQWFRIRNGIRALGLISLYLSDRQVERFNEVFEELFERARLTTDNEMNSSVIRLAINLGRIVSLVALLRALEGCGEAESAEVALRRSPLLAPEADICPDNIKDGIVTRWRLSVDDADLEATLALVEPLYLHAIHVLSFLPKNGVTNRGLADQARLFTALKREFSYQSLLEEAGKLGIPKSSARCYLQRWKKRQMVWAGRRRGEYLKR